MAVRRALGFRLLLIALQAPLLAAVGVLNNLLGTLTGLLGGLGL